MLRDGASRLLSTNGVAFSPLPPRPAAQPDVEMRTGIGAHIIHECGIAQRKRVTGHGSANPHAAINPHIAQQLVPPGERRMGRKLGS